MSLQAEKILGQVCATPPANLVAWYPGDGDANDIKGGNNGTIQGNVTYTAGEVGQTFQLGGTGNTNNSGDRVIVGNPASLRLQSFTIENWVRRSSATIVTNSPSSGFNSGIMFGYGSNGYTFEMRPDGRIILGLSGISNVDSGNLRITDTNWHHVAVTKSGDTVTLYIDGTAATVQSFGGQTFQFTTSAAIGARGDNIAEDAFFGAVDELSIYNRPLAATEIQTIYNAGSSGKCKSRTNARTDFDGDGRVDLAVYRPASATWYLNRSTAGFNAVQFGSTADRLAPADYDGDGKTDIAVWREGDFAYFYILQSSDNTFRAAQFGQTGDAPTVVGDWDGDGKADLAVYRNAASGGQSYFYYRPSAQPGVNFVPIAWGTSGDEAVRGDFDGDGKLDAAVYRAADGTWYVRRSSDGALQTQSWGLADDKRTPGDYDGDGKTDFAVFRPSTGTWYILQSSNSQARYQSFGLSTDQIVPGDYDGDGKTDIAVFRPSSGIWYILNSATGGVQGFSFGQNGDTAIPTAYLH